MNLEFFELLLEDQDFNVQLGRVTLGTNRLEAAIRKFLRCQDHSVAERATLGQLVQLLKEKGHLSSNGEMHFADIVLQRNTLTHKIYALLSGEVEETILAASNLVPLDVLYYTDKATETAESVVHFSKLILEKLGNGDYKPQEAGQPVILL